MFDNHLEYSSLTDNERLELSKSIIEYINDNKIYYLEDLYAYMKENRLDWYYLTKHTKYGRTIRTYLSSKRQKDGKPRYKFSD